MADPHVISALNAKYARLMGELRKVMRRADELRSDIAHIEATIRLFRADWDGDGIAPVTPRKVSRWGSRGQGFRLALDVLRNASEPLTAREIAIQALAIQGIEPPDAKTLAAIASNLSSALGRRLGNGVRLIEGHPKRWELAR